MTEWLAGICYASWAGILFCAYSIEILGAFGLKTLIIMKDRNIITDTYWKHESLQPFAFVPVCGCTGSMALWLNLVLASIQVY